MQIQKTKKGTLQNIQINHVSNMCVSKLLVLVANFYRPIYPLCCMRMFETNGGYKITPAEENYTIQSVSEITQIPPVTKSFFNSRVLDVEQGIQVRQQFRSSCSSSSCPPGCPPHHSQFPIPATNSISPLYTLTSPSSLPSTSPAR